jgi:hypothetical protein
MTMRTRARVITTHNINRVGVRVRPHFSKVSAEDDIVQSKQLKNDENQIGLKPIARPEKVKKVVKSLTFPGIEQSRS